jgi:betaine-aldehyde dehydrogenase
MEPASTAIAATGYYKAGQDCTAATRSLAGKGVYDEVGVGLATEAQGRVVGEIMSGGTKHVLASLS